MSARRQGTSVDCIMGIIFCFHVTSLFSKTKNSAVLVLSDVRPSNDLTFCNVSARQGFSILERTLEFQCFFFKLRDSKWQHERAFA